MAVVESVRINFDTSMGDLERSIGVLRNAGNAVNNIRTSINRAGQASISFRTNVRTLDTTLNNLSDSGVNVIGDSMGAATQSSAALSETIRSIGRSTMEVGKEVMNFGKSFTRNITVPILKGFGLAIKSSIDFEKQLSATGAISGATGKQMQQLKDQALDLGKATQYSALEVAKGQEEMLKAGRSLNQVFSETDDVLSLATAGGLEIARAAEIGAGTVNMFAKEGIKMSEVANLMAGAANASAIDVEEFSKTLEYVGPVAASLGIPLKDVSNVIGVLGNNSIKGSKAGTGLRQVLMRLQPQSDKAAAAMQSLGLETKEGGNQFYTAEGKVKPLSEVIDILRKSTDKLSDKEKQSKLKDMFGMIASPTVLSLLNSESDALEKMEKNIQKVAAADVAEERMNNFAGSIEYLMGSLDTLLVKIGDVMNPILRIVVTVVDGIVDKFLNLPKPVMQAIVVFGLLVGGIGPIITVIGFAIVAIGALVSAVGAIAGVITTIGLPVLGVLIGSLAATAAIYGVVATVVTTASVAILNALFPIRDTFKLLSSLIKSDFSGAVEILVSKFGGTEEAASKLVNRFIDVKQKGIQLFQVFKDNLVPVFNVIKDSIINAISGLDLFNNSTDETRTNTVNMFTAMIEPVQKFFNYLYKTFDSFGLIPAKVKFANDKTALSFVELNAKVRQNLNSITAFNGAFSYITIAQNKKLYTDLINNTKKSLDAELKFINQQLDKKKETQVKSAQELFKTSKVLTEKQEQERIKKLGEYFDKQKQVLKANVEKEKAILAQAEREKRQLTTLEYDTILKLRAETESKAVQLLTDSKLKQKAILEESKALTLQISREEAMNIITQANQTYDTTMKQAEKLKTDRIASAIQMRDESKIIKAQEASDMIKEAQRAYTEVTGNAKKTKDETILLATQKASGTIEQTEKEKREISDKSIQIKEVMEKIWDDIKTEIPPIVAQLVTDILKELGSKLLSGVKEKVGQAATALKNGLKNLVTNSTSVDKRVNSYVQQRYGQQRYVQRYGQNFTGTNYSDGGLSMVGEKGAELVNLPRGSKVYNNAQTRSMVSSNKQSSVIFNIYSGNNDVDSLTNQIVNKLQIAGVY